MHYKRKTSLSGFKVRGLFRVFNPHPATMSLSDIGFSISRPTGQPIKGEAHCSGTYEDGYVGTDAEGQQDAVGSISDTNSQTAQVMSSGVKTSTRTSSISVNSKKKIKLAAFRKPLSNLRQQATVQVAAVAVQAKAGIASSTIAGAADDDGYEYEEGGNGPLFCSFEAEVPDDYPARVHVYATTDEGAKAVHDLGVIDWSKAETVQSNK